MATSEDLYLATSGDFLMATDISGRGTRDAWRIKALGDLRLDR